MPSVLVVEDTESLRNIYKFALSHEGFEVETAVNGRDALTHVKERQFDVILLDMMMDGMNGVEFLRAYDIRTNAPDTRVVAFTNMDNPKVIDEAQSLGVVGYLNKVDYAPDQLVAYIKQLLATT